MNQAFPIAFLFGIPAQQGPEIGVALHQGAKKSHQQGNRLVARPAKAQVRSQVLILDEAEALFFCEGFQSRAALQTRQQPVPAVNAQQPHVPRGESSGVQFIAEAIVDDGQPAAGRQQARLNTEKHTGIGAVREGFNGIGKVGFEPFARKLQKTAFFEMKPVLLGFRDPLPGTVDLQRAQADARKASNPGQPPAEIKKAAADSAAQVEHSVDRGGALFNLPGNQFVGIVHGRAQGRDLGRPQGAVEIGGAFVFSPP